jgi:hypothetical protein
MYGILGRAPLRGMRRASQGGIMVARSGDAPGGAARRIVVVVDDGSVMLPPGEGKTVQGGAGAFVFAPQGLEHTYWNEGQTPSKMLITISPPGFERYFEELAEGLEAAGDDEQAAMSVRKALSEKYDIEVVGPPRQATD